MAIDATPSPSGVELAPAPGPLQGVVAVPGDKSISHRALILGCLVPGLSVRNLSTGEDVRRTAACLQSLGAQVRLEEGQLATSRVRGPDTWRAPSEPLDCGNSGTSMRLLMGLLAGCELEARLTGDASLCQRPMRRVAAPLIEMGARIDLSAGEKAPLTVRGQSPLAPIAQTLPVASAQVKSALILAAWHAEGESRIEDRFATRDHTERMARWLEREAPSVRSERRGAGEVVHVEPRPHGLQASATGELVVAGDASAAAFWVVAAALVPGSELILPGVGCNPRRTGALAVLRRMGAAVELTEPQEQAGEPVARWVARHAPLHAVQVRREEVPALIDEVPILAVAAAAAQGTSRFEGLDELRHKESDRLAGTVDLLRGLGVEAHLEQPDSLIVEGRPQRPFRNHAGRPLASHNDHRLAMAAAIAALAAEEPVHLDSLESTGVSDPDFVATRTRLMSTG